MKDDEYTRTIVTLDVRAGRNRVARENLPAVIRSLQRPTARGFADYLASQSSVTTILGPNGAPLGHEIEADIRRINQTGAHIIRGLHYIETGKSIPKSAVFNIGCKAELTASQPNMLTIARLLVACPERRDRGVGEAFSYVAGFADRFSVWLLLLYDYFFWVCSVDDRDLSEREPVPAPPQ
jgi:hypothetical protein